MSCACLGFGVLFSFVNLWLNVCGLLVDIVVVVLMLFPEFGWCRWWVGLCLVLRSLLLCYLCFDCCGCLCRVYILLFGLLVQGFRVVLICLWFVGFAVAWDGVCDLVWRFTNVLV